MAISRKWWHDKVAYQIYPKSFRDTNGDGKVSALDLLRVQKQIIGASKLSGTYKTAGDTNKDGKVSALDLLQVQKQIIGAGTIKQ